MGVSQIQTSTWVVCLTCGKPLVSLQTTRKLVLRKNARRRHLKLRRTFGRISFLPVFVSGASNVSFGALCRQARSSFHMFGFKAWVLRLFAGFCARLNSPPPPPRPAACRVPRAARRVPAQAAGGEGRRGADPRGGAAAPCAGAPSCRAEPYFFPHDPT